MKVMIESRSDYNYYVNCDKIALKIPEKRIFPRPYLDEIWKYEITLRKTEYHHNISGKIHRIFYAIYRLKLEKIGIKLGFSIPINVFGPGLSIAHRGTIVINPQCKIGKNCRIHEGVTVGATNGSNYAPIIGDNCFLGSGAKVIGEIIIGDNVAIGANSFVNKNFESNVTIAGVPAKIISKKTSERNIVKATEIYEERRNRK